MLRWKFSNKFRSQWIKVKFYKEKPYLEDVTRLADVKFCEATREAIRQPVLLDKESISCPGAQYAFGWSKTFQTELLQNCQVKRKTQKGILKSILLDMPHLKEPPKYIGLNTKDEPDLVISYMPPEEIMNLTKIYQNLQGKSLDVSLYTTMAICGCIATRTYLEDSVSISFGCDDSRKFADMRREDLAIGVPKRLFNVFID